MCHIQGGRFKLELDNLSEPLPSKVKEVIDNSYLSRLSSKSLEECNEEYLESHKDSAAHIQSVVRFRQILKPNQEETRSKGEKDLQTAISLDSAALTEAIEGLSISDDIGVRPEARKAYVEAAHKRWPEASIFQTQQ